MSLQKFYSKTFTVNRMVWSGESSGEVSQGAFKGHLQQADADVAENFGLAFTKAFRIWCDINTDVEIGDTLTEGSDTYSVKAINKRDYAGNNQHLEITIEKDESV